MEATDEELARQYQQGNRDALDPLIKRYYAEVLGIVRKMAGNFCAQDLAQETFLAVQTKIRSFNPALKFRPWLMTIAANKARDELKRKHNRVKSIDNKLGTDTEKEFNQALVDTKSRQAVEEIIARESIGRVFDIAEKYLRREDYYLFYSRTILGLSYQQIAVSLKIPVGTVKSRLNNVKNILKENLDRRENYSTAA